MPEKTAKKLPTKPATKTRKKKKEKTSSESSEESFEESVGSFNTDSDSELSRVTYFPHSSESEVEGDLFLDITAAEASE